MKVVVERYHGLGNDYLVFDPNHNELKLDEANVKMLWDWEQTEYLKARF